MKRNLLLIVTALVTCLSQISAATLTLDPNGGTCDVSTITVSPTTLPVCTPPDGKRFLGWATTESATAADYEYPFGLDNYAFDADVELIAVYGDIVADNGWRPISQLEDITAGVTTTNFGPKFVITMEDGTTSESKTRYAFQSPSISTKEVTSVCISINSGESLSDFLDRAAPMYLLGTSTSGIYKINCKKATNYGFLKNAATASWSCSTLSTTNASYLFFISLVDSERGIVTLYANNNYLSFLETATNTTPVTTSFGSSTGTELDQYALGLSLYGAHRKDDQTKRSKVYFKKFVAYVNVNNGSIYRAYFSPGEGGTGSIAYREGAKEITLPVASDGISKTGYILAGWQCALDGVTYAPGANYTPNGADVIFTAVWRTPKVTLNATDGTCNVLELTDFPTTLPACRATGKRFLGWKQPNSDDILPASTTFQMPTEDITLTAQYEAIESGQMWEPITAENQMSGVILAIEDGTEEVETRWALKEPSTNLTEKGSTSVSFTLVPNIADESQHPNGLARLGNLSSGYAYASGFDMSMTLYAYTYDALPKTDQVGWINFGQNSRQRLAYELIDASKGLITISCANVGGLCLVTNSTKDYATIKFANGNPITDQYADGGKKISEFEDGTYLYVWRAYHSASYYKYQVTYTCDDLHVTPPAANIVSFKKVTLPSTVTAEPDIYELLYWVDDFTGEEYQPGQTITPTTDMELRAVVRRNMPTADITVKNWDAQGVWIEYTGTHTRIISGYEDGQGQIVNTLSDCQKDQWLYHIAITDVMSHIGETVLLDFYPDAQSDIAEQNLLTIPNITSGEITYTGTEIAADQPLFVEDKLTIQGAATLTVPEVTLNAGAKLVIEDGATLEVDNITLLAGTYDNDGSYNFTYPQIEVNGTLNNTSDSIYYDYLLDNKQYYSLCLPYDVKRSEIKYADSKGTVLFEVRYYDGEERASGNSGWKSYKGDVLYAGVGYTIAAMPQKVNGVRQNYCRLRLPMYVDLSTNNTEKADKTVPVNVAVSLNPSDYGWNLIGNPFLSNFCGIGGLSEEDGIGLLNNGDWEGTARYVVIPDNDGKNYQALLASETNLPAFKCFFMQIGEGDNLLFPYTNRQAKAPKFLLAEQKSEIQLGLKVIGEENAKFKDYLGIFIADKYTADYEINADLAKFQMNNGMNIYAISGNSNLAYLAVDEQNAQNIPIGYCTTTAGTYTISMDEKYKDCGLKEVNLFDTDEGTITNLLTSSYSFVTSAQTNNNRFILQCVPSNNAPTTLGSSQNELLIYSEQGHLILLGNLNGHLSIYAIDGREVYNTTLNGSACKIPLPQGIYVIKTNQYQGKARVY